MFLLLPITLVCLLSVVIRPSIQQACIPIPVRPVDVDLDRSSGIWYEMLSGPNPGHPTEPNFQNIVVHIQRLGFISKKNTHVQAQYEEIQYYMLDATPETPCLHTYFVSNRSTCGTQRINYFIAGGPADGVTGFEDVSTLYSDPEFLEIYYKCTNLDCSGQHARVRTRKHPNLFNDEERAVVKAIVDVTLGPYCLGYNSLAIQPYNASLPVCDFVNRPAGYVATLNFARAKSFTECDVDKINE